ncbi:DUF1553 domain-containing protein [Flavilitoribacter nigricans]|uniref:DUF1553 domain-containing protein n=1 Tax=Flavilitoribacter nigricans (strain ATCC 23147 / DSM 23189 / NBRC 102662 / NCIMB 1420 / SS-2) TaxID=1122177 RepID=A0A2D0N2N5_FLAN2|nr:DUF1553 domain-containing protein [Flavilitoribacter nigricans]PHN02755.1 hypothetical protein CRP01_30695 [Flavilitoribacter nigricans DSM 23189 = NBRC 102662]
MNRQLRTLLFIFIVFLVVPACRTELPEDVGRAYRELPAELDFNIHVKPLLSDRCFACHGNDKNKLKAGLRLDEAEAAYAELPESPGKFAIRPGKPGQSEVFHRIITDNPELQMPPPEANLQLSAREKAILVKWIEDGAEYQPHWSFIPPSGAITPPAVTEAGGAEHPIDRFVYQQLRERGVEPAPKAEKASLLRRLSFDLTGLPPAQEEMEQFLADASPDAYEKQVDRLLASPHYGERMAVDWLDLARFADTHGYLADRYRDMSPWRDWVIQSFNENVPYDQFVTWQLAGDLMEEPTREQILATGFNRLHPQNAEDGIIDEEFRVSYVSDRTDVLGVGLLGLSLGCAKCHDHKYDPISQKEYYQLYSFFNNINESGLIPWEESSTPVPTLLLPTEQQEQTLGELKEQISRQEKKIEELSAQEVASIRSFVDREGHRTLSETFPSIGMIAHFDLENAPLKNKLNPSQEAKMDRRFSNNEVPTLVAGKKGKGLLLDGDAWLDLGKIGVFKRSQPFSVALQVNIPQSLENGVIFHKGFGTGIHSFRGFHLQLKDNQLELMMAHTYPDNAINEIYEGYIPRDEWIHLAVTYDGSSRADGYRVYLNGRELPTTVEIDNLYKDIIFHNMVDRIYPHPIEPGIQFGGRWRGTGLKGGVIDELMVFGRELRALEVLQLGNTPEANALLAKKAATLSAEEHQWLTDFFLNRQLPALRQEKIILQKLRTTYVDSAEAVQEVMVLKEMPQRRPAYILERGQYDVYGEEVFPTTPEQILPMPENLPPDRLGLAKWLFHPDHPLTARVAVNRYWKNLFGRGLVKSVEDFGNQGDLPDHPQLLDWLAVHFIESGWDVKALHKLIVTSATYRQSSITSDKLWEKDPENVWLARGPARRLTGEMIRDNALAASKLLQAEIGGPSVKPYQPEGLWKINNQEYRPDIGSKLYRRSLYTFWKRSVPNPTLATFDVPNRSECTVRRQATSTPLQALVLMNDPSFLEAARVIGEQITTSDDLQQGLKVAFQRLAGRAPDAEELKSLLEIRNFEYRKYTQRNNKPVGLLSSGASVAPTDLPEDELYANTVLASVMMCSDAAIVLR